jgi:long-chain acyl-CoA synthetase
MTDDPTSVPFPLQERIDAVPRAVAAHAPYAPALREAGRTITYAALVDAIDRHADLLRAHGVRRGDRVLLVAENCADQVALVFAASAVGAWAVNANARLAAPELEALRLHSGARVALYTAAVSPDAAAHGDTAGARAHGGLLVGPTDGRAAPEPARDEDIAALLYTTGTTGRPKGVMLSHRNLLFVAGVSSRLRGLGPQDRAWGMLPISHVYGLTSMMLGTLTAGACLHLAPRFSPELMLAAIGDENEGLTIAQGVPAMFARLLELLGPAPDRLRSSLRFAYAGGSPLDPSLKRRVEDVLGIPLHNGYGLTEAAPTVSQTRLDAPRADTSVGLPIPGVAVRIVDRHGRDVGIDAPGTLLVRGPNVMQGYYRDPAATAACLNPDGWLDTGDLARRDAGGALFIVGRSKDLIIRSGFNVYPLEVETVLNAHPDVTQSAVVGRDGADGNEDVVAFVQLAAGCRLAEDTLRAWAAARLAPYKRPGRIVFMAALPAAATGKVLRHVLKEMAAGFD